MTDDPPSDRQRRRRAPRPLDAARLEELALAYAARFATSAAKLERYLARKLRKRGWEGEAAPEPAALVERFAARGYVDDAGWSAARARSLLARGYGARRVEAALREGGIAEGLRAAQAPDAGSARAAALILARRRGLGPHGTWPEEREARRRAKEKQLAALLRAGHDFATARAVVEAEGIEELERWAAGVGDED